MGDVSGTWFVEEASGGSHAHDPTELRFWHPDQLCDIFERNVAPKWYTGEHLKLAEPVYAGEELVLRVTTIMSSSSNIDQRRQRRRGQPA